MVYNQDSLTLHKLDIIAMDYIQLVQIHNFLYSQQNVIFQMFKYKVHQWLIMNKER